MSLSSLARISEAGRVEAEHIVSKLWKKIGDGQAATNPSGFVHSSVKHARECLDWWRVH